MAGGARGCGEDTRTPAHVCLPEGHRDGVRHSAGRPHTCPPGRTHLPTCASRKDTGTVCGTVQAGRTPALPKDTGTMWRAVPGGTWAGTVWRAVPGGTWAGTVWRAVPGGAGPSADPAGVRKVGVCAACRVAVEWVSRCPSRRAAAPRKLGVLRDAPRTALGRCPRCCADPLRGRYAQFEASRQLIVRESVFEQCRTLDFRWPGSHEER